MVDYLKFTEAPVADKPAEGKTEAEKKPDYAKLVEEGKGLMVGEKYVSFDGDTDALIARDEAREEQEKAELAQLAVAGRDETENTEKFPRRKQEKTDGARGSELEDEEL